MSQSLVLHNPDISAEPAQFVPERWLGDNSSALDKWLVVFSRESRNCVGQHEVNAVHIREYLVLTLVCSTTWAELYVGFATVIHRFQFELRETVRRDIDPKYDHTVWFPETSRGVKVLVKWALYYGGGDERWRRRRRRRSRSAMV
jgi:hypothetical protein